MELSIIIVSWNVKDRLRQNLASIFSSQTDFSFEVFVVDNASADDSAGMVRQEFPQVRLIVNTENVGFAKANNQALSSAQGKFFLLLNPDMRLEIETLARAIAWAKANPQAAVAGFRLKDASGRTIEQARRFPRFLDQLCITLKLPHIFPGCLSRYLNRGFDYDKAGAVDSVRGSFFLINREVFKRLSQGREPRLDERYFVWFEEVDFCRQVKEMGGQIWYSPAAQAVDYIGQSFSQLPRGRAQSYFRASMLSYFRKWEPAWQARTLGLAWKLVALFFKSV